MGTNEMAITAKKLLNMAKALEKNTLSFKANLGELRKYIALDASDFYTPLKDSRTKIKNQNLKGTVFNNGQGQFQDIDYVIISPSFLFNQAEKLANFHRNYSNLNVKVIPLETIYQEFSSGKQDVAAIRNCVKYIYENASTPAKRLKLNEKTNAIKIKTFFCIITLLINFLFIFK